MDHQDPVAGLQHIAFRTEAFDLVGTLQGDDAVLRRTGSTPVPAMGDHLSLRRKRSRSHEKSQKSQKVFAFHIPMD